MLAKRTRLETAALALILLIYAVLATCYAALTPPWQIPDEPAHYNYAAQVAAEGCCPSIAIGDWDNDYLELLKASGFDPQYLDRLDTIRYENHQPPLYYLPAALVYRLTDGSLVALRLYSAVLGLGVIGCIYGIARTVSGNAVIALSAAAFAAFLPQHVAILAGVSNDVLAELVVGIGVWGAVRYVMGDVGATGGSPTPARARQASPLKNIPAEAWLGLVMGLGFLTKLSALLLGPVVMLAIFLRARQASPLPVPPRLTGARRASPLPVPPRLTGATGGSPLQWGDLLRRWALFLAPALILGALWWLRNLGVYGWPDFLGLGAHDAVVVGQLRTGDYIARIGTQAYLEEGVRTSFQSFFGQFGWMGVVMPGWIYSALLAFALVGYAGLVPLAWRARREGIPAARRDALLLLAALYVLGIAAFLYYNTSFVQFQGRYLYPALAAYALVLAAGYYGWAGLVARMVRSVGARQAGTTNRSPLQRAILMMPLGIMFGLAALSAYALWRIILPGLPAW